MRSHQAVENKKRHDEALAVAKRFEDQSGKIQVIASNARSKLKAQKFTPKSMKKTGI
tara:strand:+ start:1252 stop:1422 length:171 start_codon:yes stop_codon:yes gene_type:complete